MPDPIIDRDAIIEKAKIHIYNKVEDADWGNAHDAAAAALPVIADDLLAPIVARHRPKLTVEYLPNGVRIPWKACTCGFRTHSACPTAQAVAAIREAVRA